MPGYLVVHRDVLFNINGRRWFGRRWRFHAGTDGGRGFVIIGLNREGMLLCDR